MERKSKEIIKDTVVAIGGIAIVLAAVKYIPKGSTISLGKRVSANVSQSAAGVVKDIPVVIPKEVVAPVVDSFSGRYEVFFQNFKTGEWYRKSLSDSIASAYSVAKMGGGEGRATKLVDNHLNKVIFEKPADVTYEQLRGFK